MLIRFTGGDLSPADIPQETTAFGFTFPLGEWGHGRRPQQAMAKLKHHPLFEAADEVAFEQLVQNVFDAPKPKRGRSAQGCE
jgi:hypothetical protein